jgi:hypothetical protein
MSTDSEFSSEWRINACTVTREFLEQLERAIQNLEADIFGDTTSRRTYQLSVFDAFGSETFRTVGDIPMRWFPETTDMVRMVLDSSSGDTDADDMRSLKLKVVFRVEHGNRMSVRLRGPLAREKVIGFCERVDQLVEPYEIDSWLFKRYDWVIGVCGFVAILGGIVWLANTYDQFTGAKTKMGVAEYWKWTAAVGAASAYWAIVHWFYPVCAFETRGWAQRQEWRKWAVQGFLSLIVFGTVVTFVGRRLLGALGIKFD